MLNKKMLLSIVAATLLLSAAVADAFGDEMSWELKNKNTKLSCHLSEGMTLRHGNDFVETKKLVCWRGTELVVSSQVSCGPEGSKTRFDGKKIVVTCSQKLFASK